MTNFNSKYMQKGIILIVALLMSPTISLADLKKENIGYGDFWADRREHGSVILLLHEDGDEVSFTLYSQGERYGEGLDRYFSLADRLNFGHAIMRKQNGDSPVRVFSTSDLLEARRVVNGLTSFASRAELMEAINQKFQDIQQKKAQADEPGLVIQVGQIQHAVGMPAPVGDAPSVASNAAKEVSEEWEMDQPGLPKGSLSGSSK